MNKNAPPYVLGFIAVLCTVFGAGVATVHYATRDLLAANERLQHNRVLCDAFELPVADRSPAAYARAIEASIEVALTGESHGERRVYRRHDDGSGKLGFPFSGMGFWGPIDGFITLDADRETIFRLRFFDHQETPGLGARIEEPWFLDQFDGLPIDWDAPAPRRVLFGATADRDAENRADAITGATQTSNALRDFLNAELERIRAIDIDALSFTPVDKSEI